MTLEDALALYLYFLDEDTTEERDERIIDAAWEVIERQAKKAIGSLPENGPGQ